MLSVALLILPEWLLSEKYLTLATWGLVLCTAMLVVATLVLWVDSARRGNAQTERWAREDRAVADAKQPKYQFGLKRSIREPKRVSFVDYVAEPQVHLWIGNLGGTGLYVERLYVKHRDFDSGVLDVNEVVRSGDQLKFDIPDSFWQQVPGIGGSKDGVYLYGDHEIWLKVSDGDSYFKTEPVLYTFIFLRRHFSKLERGSSEERQPKCPKCHLLINAVLPATQVTTERELKAWKLALGDLEASCPQHKSPLLRFFEIPAPPWV